MTTQHKCFVLDNCEEVNLPHFPTHCMSMQGLELVITFFHFIFKATNVNFTLCIDMTNMLL